LHLVDTHCHLNYESFHADLEEVLKNSRSHGISHILIPGTDLDSSRLAIKIASENIGLYSAVGIHPNDALTWKVETIHALKELAMSEKVCAIGEIGLDYYRDHAPRTLQIDILQAQLGLAASLQKPVILHSRLSLDDLFSILADWRKELIMAGNPLAEHPGVLHSFEGTLEEALQAIQMGFKIGISGPVTYKNAREKHRLVQGLDLDSILLETDAPFLTPHPHRGQRNEPAFIPFIAQKIADLKGLPVEMVANVTTNNARELFSWA